MKRALIPIAVFALILTACSAVAPEPREISIEASALKFQPASIEVEAGQPVRLTFNNQDTVDHDFTVLEIPLLSGGPTQESMAGHDMGDMEGTEPDLHVLAAAGQSAVLEFTPTVPSSYEFFCTVPGHKEAGMVGILDVK